MLDHNHPIVRQLTQQGFELSAHAYLRGDRVKTTVAAKHRQLGRLIQGWSSSALDGALLDLARRAGLWHD